MVMGIIVCYVCIRFWGIDGGNVIVLILNFLIDCIIIRNIVENIFWLIILVCGYFIIK